MAKTRHVSVNIESESLRSLTALAGTFGVSAEDVIRRSLPDEAVVKLFFQCKDYLPELQWDQVAEVGRQAVREHLRATYRRGLDAHLARLGISLEGTPADAVEAAKQRALEELRADSEHPLDPQIARAEHDSVYLGWLYDAWRRAKAGESGYAIARLGTDGGSNGAAWAVLRDNQVV